MRRVVVENGGIKRVGAIAKSGGTTWFSFCGEVWTVDEESRGRRGAAGSSSLDPGSVKAPMPGKIIKVNGRVGEKVAQGEVVVVMEAMKMEYTLKSGADGTIEKVHVQAGDQVVLGAILVSLEVTGGVDVVGAR